MAIRVLTSGEIKCDACCKQIGTIKTTTNLIIEGKMHMWAAVRRVIAHDGDDDVSEQYQEDWLRTAIKEAIIEGIEAVLPPQITKTSLDDNDENFMSIGFNVCRAHILQSLQALKKQS